MDTQDWESRDMTPEEMEKQVGKSLRRYRINMQKMDQESLAARAGVSVRTLRSLELGSGSSLRTFMQVVRALGRYSWFASVAPTIVNSQVVVKKVKERKRVHKPRSKKLDDDSPI